jgi:hypothetical protein
MAGGLAVPPRPPGSVLDGREPLACWRGWSKAIEPSNAIASRLTLATSMAAVLAALVPACLPWIPCGKREPRGAFAQCQSRLGAPADIRPASQLPGCSRLGTAELLQLPPRPIDEAIDRFQAEPARPRLIAGLEPSRAGRPRIQLRSGHGQETTVGPRADGGGGHRCCRPVRPPRRTARASACLARPASRGKVACRRISGGQGMPAPARPGRRGGSVDRCAGDVGRVGTRHVETPRTRVRAADRCRAETGDVGGGDDVRRQPAFGRDRVHGGALLGRGHA